MTTYLYFYSQIILLLSRFVNIVSVQGETTSFPTGMYMYVHYHTVTQGQKLSNYLCRKHLAQYSIFDVWLNVAFWNVASCCVLLMMTWKKIPKSDLKIPISNPAGISKLLWAKSGSWIIFAQGNGVHRSLTRMFMRYSRQSHVWNWFLFSLFAKLYQSSSLSCCFFLV